MGLACSQVTLLTLTRRKADVELDIALNARRKMALTSEMSELTREYNSKLQAKNISYYYNNEYHKVSYGYLMGYGANHSAITNGDKPLKEDNNMILTDHNGMVVLNNTYASAIENAGLGILRDNDGRGKGFNTSYIPKILATLLHGFSEEEIANGVKNYKFNTVNVNTLSGEATGKTGTKDATEKMQAEIDQVVNFYYPIFLAAATNGWTTEYEKPMSENPDYISDAINSGLFHINSVSDNGQYDEGTTLTYYVMAGLLNRSQDSDKREELKLWYDQEKAQINEKETYIDLTIEDLSTELESIKTEIQSIKTFINDAVQSVFDWGGS